MCIHVPNFMREPSNAISEDESSYCTYLVQQVESEPVDVLDIGGRALVHKAHKRASRTGEPSGSRCYMISYTLSLVMKRRAMKTSYLIR